MKNPRFWLGILVSAAALFLAFREVDLAEVGHALRDADYVWLVPGLALGVASIFFRAVRWRVLFYPNTSIPLGRLFGILNVGYLISNLLPLRLGDFARAYLVGQMQLISKMRALSTVAVERVLDILSVLVITVLLIPFVPVPGWAATPLWLAGVLGTAAIVTMLVTSVKRHHTLALLEWALRFLPRGVAARIHRLADSAIDGFSAIRSPRAASQAVLWSAATWFTGGLSMWVMLSSFDLPRSFTAGMFVLAISAIGMVVPSSPGYVGVYHAVVIETLVKVFGADRAQAASYAVVTHLVLFLPPVLLGVYYIWREPYTWSGLLRWSRRSESEPEEVATGQAPGP